MASMLSPRLADGQRPTLANFGCFIPRPNAPSGQSGQSPPPSTFSKAMLSPRFLFASEEKPQRAENAMRKALDRRGGLVKERDGFEIFYGVDPKKQARPRRRASTGGEPTSDHAVAQHSQQAASKQVTSKVASSSQPSSSSKAAPPGAHTAERSATSGSRRPDVPRLVLGAPKTEAPISKKGSQPQRARRMTAPPEVSQSVSTPRDAMTAVSSFFGSAFSKLEAVTSERVTAVVDAAVDAAIGTSSSSTTPAPMSARRKSSGHSATSGDSTAKRSPRLSTHEKVKLTTPRGVPVYALSGSSAMLASKPLPDGVEAYSLASPSNSPTPSYEPHPVAPTGESNPNEAAEDAKDATQDDAEEGDSSQDVQPVDQAEQASIAVAARRAVPMLSLATVRE